MSLTDSKQPERIQTSSARVVTRAIAALGLLLIAVSGGCRTAPDAAASRLTVLHVNDTHSHAFPFSAEGGNGGFARLATVVKQARGGDTPVLLLHGGDAVMGSGATYLANGRPDYERIPSYGYRGILDFEAMNLLGFDAMVLGNHEFDYGKRWLEGLVARARFPVLSANVVKREIPDIDGSRGRPVVKPYVVLRPGGLRVGVIGLTTTEFIKSLQVEVRDPIAAARELVSEVARLSDLVVVLSHVGLDQDLRLVRSVPGIDLVVGGHTHTELRVPVPVGRTVIVQAGAHGTQVGVLDLTISGGTIKSYRYELKRLDRSIALDPEVDAALRRRLAIGSVAGQAVRSSRDQQSSLGSLATDAMLEATAADVALLASGALTGDLGPGELGVRQFFDVFWPYRRRNLTPEKELSERQLLTMVNRPADAALRAVARGSDGLRTLVVVRLPPGRLAQLLAGNEGRRGTDGYLQVGSRNGLPLGRVDPGADSRATLSVVMPIDLAVRLGDFGLPLDPGQVEVKDLELFEAVLIRLQKRGSESRAASAATHGGLP